MENLVSQYIDKLKSYKEDDFTKEIIAPLFESMGYQRVEFNGGPYERGRDLIATIKVPPHKDPKVVYIQSKKIGNQKRGSSRVISDLGHQIRQSCLVGYKTLENTLLLPSEIYIACPEVVTQRFLEEVQQQFMENTRIPITILDGQAIVESIFEYNPELLKKLSSIEEQLLLPNNNHGNSDLLNALKSSRRMVNVQEFYSDLSFFVGSIDSNELMHLKIDFKKECIFLDEELWRQLKPLYDKVFNEFSLGILVIDPVRVDEKYKQSLAEYNSKENKELIKSLGVTKKFLEDIKDRIDVDIDELALSIDSIVLQEKDNDLLLEILSGIKVSLKGAKVNFKLVELTHEEPELQGLSESRVNNINNYFSSLNGKVVILNGMCSEAMDIEKEIASMSKSIVRKPRYEAVLNFELISLEINNRRERYKLGVEKVNSRRFNFIEIKRFLEETERTLYFISLLKESSGLKPFIKGVSLLKSDDRVSISPLDVFSTDLDIAVYGGAGVGKTTTLEAYYTQLDKTKLIKILLPLNRLAHKVSEMESVFFPRDIQGDLIDDSNNLLYKLILTYKGVEITKSNLIKLEMLLSGQSAKLILDGIDEVYNVIPNVFRGINDFKQRHPNVQLVVSSRDCVSYLDEINFLGITLLPFSESQIENFIKGWFVHKPGLANDLLKSIHERNLFDCLRTPLVLTITCSLVEKGIDAPSTESEIYEARLSLLTGEYDKVKMVDRQSNSGTLLKKIATRLAYIMHTKNIRTISEDIAITELKNSFGNTYEKQLITSLINDLVNPSNILIFDKFNGTLSFGHFRFQEHLASLELSQNRSVDMADLTRSDWWRGALCLYAQSNDIEFLVDEVYKKFHSLGRSEITLREMQKVTLLNRRFIIDEIINRTVKLDVLDDIFNNNDYYNNLEDSFDSLDDIY
jgi:hypothetical protein